MTPEQLQAIDSLARFLATYQRAGSTRRQFWTAFDAQGASLEALANAPDADPELRERYFEILDAAHQVYGGPDEVADELLD